MNAIILAAGQGIRLLPLTKNKPKCMLEFVGKTIIQRLIETFRNCGINDISVVKGYNSGIINFSGIKYFTNDQYAKTNMLQSLFCGREKIKDSTIISYADIIFEENVLKKLIKSKDDISLVVDKEWIKYWKLRVDDPIDDANETVVLDKKNFLIDIGQKVNNIEDADGHFIGLMKVQNDGIRQFLDFYDKTKNFSLKNPNILNPSLTFEKSRLVDLLQGLIKSGCKMKAVMIENNWLEFDTLKDFEIYNKLLNTNSLSQIISLDNNK